MIAGFITSFLIGLFIGIIFLNRNISDIDLENENLKLRKENEVLWARLKDEGKINKF